MPTISPEIRQAIEQSGGAPLRLEDPQSRESYVLIRAEQFEALKALIDDDLVTSAYPALDETFREGWEAPGMSDYDEYEKHRP